MNIDKIPLFLLKPIRELAVTLSMLALRRVTLIYRGLKVRVPLIYGIGWYHFTPDFPLWSKHGIQTALKIYPDRAIVDIGVNVGQFLLNLKSVDQNVTYYGFEPNPPCIFYLYELIRLNRFKKTYIFPVAVSNKEQISYLYSRSWVSGTSSLVADFSPSKEEFSTTIFAVDGKKFLTNINQKIGMVKIDVEGYELEVVEGLQDLLAAQRPIVYCEILVALTENNKINSNLRKIYELVTNLNYVHLKSDKDSLPVEISSIEDYKSQWDNNYYFVPRELLSEFQANFRQFQG